MSKNKLIKKLNEEYSLINKDKEIVFGDGNLNSKIMFIGEAPGKEEVRQKKPFVGQAGQNLTEFLDFAGLKRNEVYITNAIKFRLSKTNNKTGRVINRPAERKEIEDGRYFLYKEIGIVLPDYIISLGNVALRAVTGNFRISIGEVHGMFIKNKIDKNLYNLFPLYHPASIIYNRKLEKIYKKDICTFKNYYSIKLKRKNNID